MVKRFIASLVCITFILSNFQYVHAQDFNINQLPQPGSRVNLSSNFIPLTLKGLVIHPENALKFDFLMDTGNSHLDGAPLKEEALKVMKYFLTALTIPEDDLWVNLSPYEKGKTVETNFGGTLMGRDLLAEDYILKQLTASLIYPEEELGKKFWKEVYQKAKSQLGTTQIPVNTFNKVWIVPSEAVVWEHDSKVMIVKSHLKVMLDEDYLSLKNHTGAPQEKTHALGSQVVRDIVLPVLEKQVNEGEHFAKLRQMYQAMILATWYKKALKESIITKVYANQKKIKGVDNANYSDIEDIYQQYIKAFKKGAFDYIKEDIDPVTGQATPRKYFSGGFSPLVNGVTSLGVALGVWLGSASQLSGAQQADINQASNNVGNMVLVQGNVSEAGIAKNSEKASSLTMFRNIPPLATTAAVKRVEKLRPDSAMLSTFEIVGVVVGVVGGTKLLKWLLESTPSNTVESSDGPNGEKNGHWESEESDKYSGDRKAIEEDRAPSRDGGFDGEIVGNYKWIIRQELTSYTEYPPYKEVGSWERMDLHPGQKPSDSQKDNAMLGQSLSAFLTLPGLQIKFQSVITESDFIGILPQFVTNHPYLTAALPIALTYFIWHTYTLSGIIGSENINRLEKYLSKRNYEQLLKLLSHKNYLVRFYTLEAIGQKFLDSRSTPYLLERLKDDKLVVRIASAQLLNKLQDNRGVESLLESLKKAEKEKDYNSYNSISNALHKLNHTGGNWIYKDEGHSVTEIVGDDGTGGGHIATSTGWESNWILRSRDSAMLGQSLSSFLTLSVTQIKLQPVLLENDLINLISTHPWTTVSIAVGMSIGITYYLWKNYTFKGILSLYGEKRQERLKQYLNKQEFQTLLYLVKHEDTLVRKETIEVLNKLAINSDRQYEAGVLGLNSEDSRVAKWAIDLLAKSGKNVAIGLIEKMIFDKNEDLRESARRALDLVVTDNANKYQLAMKAFYSLYNDNIKWAIEVFNKVHNVDDNKKLYHEELFRLQEKIKTLPEFVTMKIPISWKFIGQDTSYVGSGGAAHDMYESDEGEYSYDKEGPSYKEVAVANSEVYIVQERIKMLLEQLKEKDNAMQGEKKDVGGISLDSKQLDLQIKRDGHGAPLPISQQPLDQINIEGFLPTIIDIKPISLPDFLGLNFINKKTVLAKS